IPMHVQKTDGLVLERRAAAVVTEVDARTLLDRIDHAESPTLVAAVQIGHVDTIIDPIVAEKPNPIPQRRRTKNRDHQVGPGRHAPGRQRRPETGLLIRQLEPGGDIEQPTDPQGTVDHEPPESARAALEAQLQDVIRGTADLGQVMEEVVYAEADRAG